MSNIENHSVHGVLNMENILNALWEKSSKNMTIEDLEWFRKAASEVTEEVIQGTISVSDGIGCLVSEDGSHPSGAGNFQRASDVPELLFFISHQLRTVAALTNIAFEARFLLTRANGGRA